MLRNLKDLKGYAIHATDGIVGHVTDIYFDDQKWVVRYFVVETGSWLSSRKVLISPIGVGKPDWEARLLPTSITKEQVKSSPQIDTDKPVSRQHERRHLSYFGYPYYWDGASLWGSGAYPGAMLTGVGYERSGADYLVAQTDQTRGQAEADAGQDGDAQLRSCNAVMGYHVAATDGDIGTVQALLVDEETWAVRYMVVDTGSWWLAHQVLIAPQWIRDVRWSDETVAVYVTQRAVKSAPFYDSSVPPTRDQEMHLYEHHGRDGYWADELRLETAEYRPSSSMPKEAIHKYTS